MFDIKEHLKDIGDIRNSEELKKYIFTKYVEINSNIELKKLYMLRKGLFEKFHAELIPLYLFSQIYDDKTLKTTYQLILGNQKYDAIVKNENSEFRLEFTEFFNGKNNYETSLEIVESGISSFVISDCFKAETDYIKLFEENVNKKCKKGYENLHLIFVITPHYLDFLADDEVDDFIEKLVSIVGKFDFQTNRVSLLIKKGHVTDEEVRSKLINIF